MSMVSRQTVLHPINIARICHEANRALQMVLNDPSIPISDPWEETRHEVQRSARMGVEAIMENPDLTPEESHERWLDFKLENGWVWGPVKDEDAKTHPLMVPYAEVPEADRYKDALFCAIVRALLPASGSGHLRTR